MHLQPTRTRADRPARAPDPARDAGHRGLLLGAVGVVVFAFSIPMTRLASGSAQAPQLDPVFVAIGRAALAGMLAAAYLAVVRAPRPKRAQWLPLALTALGVVFGWPLFLGWAVRHVQGVHASVVTGVLPLATAAMATLYLRQRGSAGFWACALLGAALVLGFAWARSGSAGFQPADGLLLLAVLSASFGYVTGTRLSGQMAPEHVISWILVISLPVTLPIAFAFRPAHPAEIAPGAWAGFLYVSLFSMWLGFFAWYRGLAIGGALRVSQVQLLQPFLSMWFSVPILGESVDATTLVFSLAVMAVVFAGKRLSGPPRQHRLPVRPTPGARA